MSAIGTKRTSLVAPHMSAFGGKADMPSAAHMSAFDPKRTSAQRQFAIRSNLIFVHSANVCMNLKWTSALVMSSAGPQSRASPAEQALRVVWSARSAS